MAPIIRPLDIPRVPPTGYVKERDVMAAMQAECEAGQPARPRFLRRLAA